MNSFKVNIYIIPCPLFYDNSPRELWDTSSSQQQLPLLILSFPAAHSACSNGGYRIHSGFKSHHFYIQIVCYMHRPGIHRDPLLTSPSTSQIERLTFEEVSGARHPLPPPAQQSSLSSQGSQNEPHGILQACSVLPFTHLPFSCVVFRISSIRPKRIY